MFNSEQCNLPEGTVPTKPPKPRRLKPVEECEAIGKGWGTGPKIHHKEQNAFYRLNDDIINLPKRNSFNSIEE